ncbi:hypothetical protein BJ546DRAFT_323164 [Cryomyces antarcticus]
MPRAARSRTNPALPCLALPCLALPCLALPCLALPCLALPCLGLPRPVFRRSTEDARTGFQGPSMPCSKRSKRPDPPVRVPAVWPRARRFRKGRGSSGQQLESSSPRRWGRPAPHSRLPHLTLTLLRLPRRSVFRALDSCTRTALNRQMFLAWVDSEASLLYKDGAPVSAQGFKLTWDARSKDV